MAKDPPVKSEPEKPVLSQSSEKPEPEKLRSDLNESSKKAEPVLIEPSVKVEQENLAKSIDADPALKKVSSEACQTFESRPSQIPDVGAAGEC